MSDLAVAKRTKAEEVRKRIKAGKCLICNAESTLRRGLCQRHYQIFLRRLKELSKPERVDFETRAIREGLVLGVQQQQQIRREDPFSEI